MKKKKVALGMSGGVDSSVCASLLLEQGHDVTGVYIQCWRGPGCRAEEDKKDALDVALQLGIPFTSLDFIQEYKQSVVNYFYKEYEAGRTPNPDTMCNREIKFGLFYDWAMENGFDYVATGHYAQVKSLEAWKSESVKVINSEEVVISNESEKSGVSNKLVLARGKDSKKDQSYFLYLLKPEQLAHILFPIGNMTKDQVRKEAEQRNLPVASKPDSQGICFIGEVSITDFLKELGMKEKIGKVFFKIPQKNQLVEIGEQKGAWFYTVGQRHGFEVFKAKFKHVADELPFAPESVPPLYIIDKNVDTNELIIGIKEQLYSDSFEVAEINWIKKPKEFDNILIRIRHGGELVRGNIKAGEEKTIKVTLEKPVFGIAPGQACVFYEEGGGFGEEVVLGGGVIV